MMSRMTIALFASTALFTSACAAESSSSQAEADPVSAPAPVEEVAGAAFTAPEAAFCASGQDP